MLKPKSDSRKKFQKLVPLFQLGQLVQTPAAKSSVNWLDILNCIKRHQCGDFGECDAHDTAANRAAIKDGNRVFSVYFDRNNTRFWIITEADRSSTCVLLPEDY